VSPEEETSTFLFTYLKLYSSFNQLLSFQNYLGKDPPPTQPIPTQPKRIGSPSHDHPLLRHRRYVSWPRLDLLWLIYNPSYGPKSDWMNYKIWDIWTRNCLFPPQGTHGRNLTYCLIWPCVILRTQLMNLFFEYQWINQYIHVYTYSWYCLYNYLLGVIRGQRYCRITWSLITSHS
jgi:hypothetical protein